MAMPDGSSSETARRNGLWLAIAIGLAILAGGLGTWRVAGGWPLAFGSTASMRPHDLTYTSQWTSSAKASPTVTVEGRRANGGVILTVAVKNPDSTEVQSCSVTSLLVAGQPIKATPLMLGRIPGGGEAKVNVPVGVSVGNTSLVAGRVELSFAHADGTGTATDTADIPIR